MMYTYTETAKEPEKVYCVTIVLSLGKQARTLEFDSLGGAVSAAGAVVDDGLRITSMDGSVTVIPPRTIAYVKYGERNSNPMDPLDIR
jgi:hypothetical protein